jgi:PRC-barrel domain
MSTKHFYFLATTATAMLMFIAVAAVSHAQAPDQRMDRMGQPGGHALKASELIGLGVHANNNEEKGKIKDLMISPSGQVEYAAVSFGGFLGIGDKLFAVPLDALQIEWKDNKPDHARCDITEETIKQRQGFDNNNWPERADRGFTMNQAGRPVDHTQPNR